MIYRLPITFVMRKLQVHVSFMPENENLKIVSEGKPLLVDLEEKDTTYSTCKVQ